MKAVTRTVYFERIDHVMACLQRAVNDGGELPDLTELAAIAHLSPFHFHRVYRALTGETPGHTVARLRLLRSLHLLGGDDSNITEVAMSIGYETPQAFARAFREAFGASPADLRTQPQRIVKEMDRLSRPPARGGETSPLSVDVVSIDPFEVVALRTLGGYADLDQAYGRLFGWAAAAGIVDKATSLFGLPLQDHRDTPAAELGFDCALRFSIPVQPPEPMRLLLIGGGDYACVRHVGSFIGLEETTDRLLADWLPDSRMMLRDAPIHYTYLDDPEQTPELLLRTDIYVPVQAEKTS